MKKEKIVFFGRKEIENPDIVEDRLLALIEISIKNDKFVEFVVGLDGDFDRLVVKAVREIRKMYGYDNYSLTLLLPYHTLGYKKYPQDYHRVYDKVEISETASLVPKEEAVGVRNREMLDSADSAICYVPKKYGDEYEMLKYAEENIFFVSNIAEHK